MPALEIVKTSDKKIYDFGDVVHYTITVKQTDKDAVANNVIITDERYSDGLKIDIDSVVVKGVEKYTVSKTDLGFNVVADELKYGDTITITYDATMEDEKLAGTVIYNTATATCDHIKDGEPVESTVKSAVNEKESQEPDSTIQTGDNTNMFLPMIGMLVSVMLVVTLSVKRKRTK